LTNITCTSWWPVACTGWLSIACRSWLSIPPLHRWWCTWILIEKKTEGYGQYL
jgi:hypothetical protein